MTRGLPAIAGALRIFPQANDLYHAAASEFVACAGRAILAHDRFTIALAGGDTPRPLYELLASQGFAPRVDWARTEIFFGDERCVSPGDARSNFRMAADALLRHVPIPPGQIHRIHGEEDPAVAALRCVQALRATFRSVRMPRFDLILLGVGDNGHTASLFPGSAALNEYRRLAVSQYVETQKEWRITLTLPVINAAREIWVLAQGTAKAPVLQRIFEGPFMPEVLPAQALAPGRGRLVWWMDQAAAAGSESKPG